MLQDEWTSDCGRYRLLLGDSLAILPDLPEASIDAILTDPPYSSGGAFRGDRMQSTIDKYVRSDTASAGTYSQFTGDNRDQRAFMAWCSMWLTAGRYACKPGAVLCAFIDWRQLPTLTDAVQAGGWVWRNLATWWKPGCRMQKGRFSGSAEYVVYATNGPHDMCGMDSPQNVFVCPTLAADEKEHIAEKPAPVCDWLVGTTAGGVILDPFMGSGAIGAAAVRRDIGFIGIDNDRRSFETARDRIREAMGLPVKDKHGATQHRMF